jgi:hypothetical protein
MGRLPIEGYARVEVERCELAAADGAAGRVIRRLRGVNPAGWHVYTLLCWRFRMIDFL